MPDSPSIASVDVFRRSGPLLAQRQQNPTSPLDDAQKTLLQEATVAIVTELKYGKSAHDIRQMMIVEGWQPDVADGFISLVSQLLSKMYAFRTWIFSGMTLFTAMIASIAVPMAARGEFPWLGAVLSVAVTCVSLLATLRNFQLWRRYRQPTSN